MEFRAMGTTISLLLPEARFYEGVATVQQLFSEWEQALSRFLPESELSQVNQRARTEVRVSRLMATVLQAALAAAHETNGLYDPTLLHQLIAIGYDRSFEYIQHARRETPTLPAQPGGGWRNIQFDPHRRTVTLPEGVGVDFGGIAKGMAVDAALKQLQQSGITPALVNAGGDLAVRGLPPEDDQWSIAIQGKHETWVIPLRQGAIATSGIAKRRWQQGTQMRHHLIDPRTGESAQSSLWSVTTVASHCIYAEIAAKTAFLLDQEEGRDFLTQHKMAGILVRTDGTWTTAGPWPTNLMQPMEQLYL
jgi:thiamine biosynthesis lipoprotein